MIDKIPNLRAFQSQFGDYIRKQRHDDADNVPNRVGRLYQSLIYNNVSGFVNQCFPVCRQIVQNHFGIEIWQNLIKDFLKYGDMASPYFSQINEQFVAYLTDEVLSRFDLPLFLGELAHYEWIELYVDNLPNTNPKPCLIDNHHTILMNPTVQILYYEWAVSDISVSFLPKEKKPNFIIVYRKNDDKYKTAFMSINQLGFVILTFLQENTNQGVVYRHRDELRDALQKTFKLNDEVLSMIDSSFDELMTTMIDNQVCYVEHS